jgi:NAD(P)-dependent dehydrogenase (short-subunit alcohol dehydrogenase family)
MMRAARSGRIVNVPLGIDVVVVEPGAIQTEWAGVAMANIARTSEQSAYQPITERIVAAFGRMKGLGAPPVVVARHPARGHSASASHALWIAFFLGYEELNSFARASHGWEGTTPARWRDATRQ